MQNIISLDRSLVVRIGQATFQLHRLLEDGVKIQLENQMTGELKVFQTSDFYRKLNTREIQVVLGSLDGTDPQAPKFQGILDLSSLPPSARARLSFQISIIRYLQKKRISRGQRHEIARSIDQLFAGSSMAKGIDVTQFKRPSTSAVMDWMRRFELSAQNPRALISGNLTRKRTKSLSPLVEQAINWALDKHYLTRNRHSLKFAFDQCIDKASSLADQQKISRAEANVCWATFARRKDELDPFMVLSRRFGPAYAAKEMRVTMDGTVATRAMQRYEVDHTPLNWVVICDTTGLPLGRPTLTVVVDTFSGYVVGIYVSFNGPSLTAVMNVIKNAIRPKDDLVAAAGGSTPWIALGVSEGFTLDNGMEFHAKSFQLACWELAADMEFCKVRTPWMKPHVERFFASLDFLALTPGRIHKPLQNVLNIDPKADASIPLSLLCKGLVLFALDVNGNTPNSRTLEIPFERFSESIQRNPAPRLPSSVAGLDLIAAMSKELVVSHAGVEFNGLTYSGWETKELINSAGGKFKTLVKWNPDCLGLMNVRHPMTQEWITLPCTRPDYALGLTWNQHRLLRKFARERMKVNGTADNLLRARQHLQEIWHEPLAKKNKSLDMQQARKFAGQTTPTFGTPIVPSVSTTPPKLIADEEVVFDAGEIPSFETFSM